MSLVNDSNTNCSSQSLRFEPETFSYYFTFYVFPIIFAFGIVGNVLNIIIFKRLQTKSNLFLLIIAIADLCFYFPNFLLNLVVYDTLASSESFLKLYYNCNTVLLAMGNWFSTASIWFAIAITVERLLVIRSPLSAVSVCGRKRLTCTIATIWLFTAILQTPQFLWFTVVTDQDCQDPTKTVYAFRRITSDQSHYEVRKYLYIISPMIIVVIPLIALITLNLLLIYYLRLNNQQLNKLGTSSNKNRNVAVERIVTKRISFIVITFFVFNFPSAVLGVWATMESNVSVYEILTDIPADISDNLVIISKAINFPLYCFINESFRIKLFSMFSPVEKLYTAINNGNLQTTVTNGNLKLTPVPSSATFV